MAKGNRNAKLVEQGVAYIERIRREPLWWVETTMRHSRQDNETTLEEDPNRSWELDGFQRDLLNAVADVWRGTKLCPQSKTVINHEHKAQISVVSGHGPGKTHTAALIAHYVADCWPARIIVTAPKFDQIKTRLFAAIHKIDMRGVAWRRKTHELGETTCYWKTEEGTRDHDHCILGETAKNPENLAGHHSQFQLVLIEEATGVPEVLFPVIFGALSTGVMQILFMISNGTQRTGSFADSHLKPKESANYFTYKISFEQSHRVSRKWANRLIEKYGAESPIVKVRVFGEFASDEPGQLIALQWLNAARNKEYVSDGSIPRRRISIDVAGGGVCENVLVVGEHHASFVRVRKIKRASFDAAIVAQRTADMAEQLWRDYNLSEVNGDTFVVDSIGLGNGVAGELLKRRYPVIMHVGGASSADPKRWRNQRVQAYLVCRNCLRDSQVVLDADACEDESTWDDLEAQLTAIRTRENGERVEDLETKDELVTRLGFSPDIADALSMQWSTIAPTVVTGSQTDYGQEVAVIMSSTVGLSGMVR